MLCSYCGREKPDSNSFGKYWICNNGVNGYFLKIGRFNLAVLATYKYNLYMAPVQRDIKYVLKQFTETKFRSVMNGEYDLLISPLYLGC